jgi:hypothetical protein
MFVTKQTFHPLARPALTHRSEAFGRQQHCARIHRHAKASAALQFFNVLTGPELLQITEEHLPEHRERLYPPTVTLSMFLHQALAADSSCQAVVNAWAASRAAEGLSAHSVRTGGYCRARQRLPLSMVQALSRHSAQELARRTPEGWRWRGRSVKLLDGTGISMPDTPANQAIFPQPKSQASGVGFPMARLCALIDLASGAVLEAATAAHYGAGHSELGLSRTLLGALCPGDVLLADALYANYWLIAELSAAGVDVVLRQHGSRCTDFRRGVSLGVRDHVVHWSRPAAVPQWMSRAQYHAMPEQLTMREVRVNGGVLVTTMRDPRLLSKAQLGALYRHRWNVELDLRCIKTTLGMEVLRCLTPAMVEKELWVYLLAYNLIRLLMAQAAADHCTQPRALSFKHTVQLYNEFTARSLCRPETHNLTLLFALIAQQRVGHRPGRIEPRARKRRPKSFQWLKVPRVQARRQIKRLGYLPNPSHVK